MAILDQHAPKEPRRDDRPASSFIAGIRHDGQRRPRGEIWRGEAGV